MIQTVGSVKRAGDFEPQKGAKNTQGRAGFGVGSGAFALPIACHSNSQFCHSEEERRGI